jgi:hypothetical protein
MCYSKSYCCSCFECCGGSTLITQISPSYKATKEPAPTQYGTYTVTCCASTNMGRIDLVM